jgi:hypothetical protein
MTTVQRAYYEAVKHRDMDQLTATLDADKAIKTPSLQNLLMQLRKVCNHPCLMDTNFDNFYQNCSAWPTSRSCSRRGSARLAQGAVAPAHAQEGGQLHGHERAPVSGAAGRGRSPRGARGPQEAAPPSRRRRRQRQEGPQQHGGRRRGVCCHHGRGGDRPTPSSAMASSARAARFMFFVCGQPRAHRRSSCRRRCSPARQPQGQQGGAQEAKRARRNYSDGADDGDDDDDEDDEQRRTRTTATTASAETIR